MTRRLFILAVIMTGIVHLTANAQPSWTKKATKAIFTLKTFSTDGTLVGSATGFFTDEQGTAVSSFTPFKGAASAVVIDAQGRELAVECMLGANDTYDVARFRVAAKKTDALPIAAAPSAEGTAVWLMPYRQTKAIPQGTVRKAETFNDSYAYYTVALTMPEGTLSCPLINDSGEAIGLMQQPAVAGDTLSYAVSAAFAQSLTVNGLSINDPTLRATAIKQALPDNIDQARLTLYLVEMSHDTLRYDALVDDFIAKFPQSPDGYNYRAHRAMLQQRFDDAKHDMELAISFSDKKDEAHYNYAELIYTKEVYMSKTPYPEWSLDMALEQSQLAWKTNPQPVYRRQQAVILYAQKKYAEAAEVYATLFDTSLRSAELFYEASRCHLMLRDTTATLALLDSCVAMYDKPYLKEAAPYLYARAQARLEVQRFREAAQDMNDYEALMANKLDDQFYYLRHQANIGGRLFQQALDDISKAISLNPDNELYYAEKASLQVRVSLYDDAIETANECIRRAPDYSDGYLFLGLAQCLKGQKTEGRKNLTKAKELGDAQADALIEKYAK